MCISSSTGEMSQVECRLLDTSCRCDVEEFQEEVKVAQITVVEGVTTQVQR